MQLKTKIVLRACLSLILSLFIFFRLNEREVKAVDIGLIGGATTNSSFEEGVLSVGVQGGSAVGVSVASVMNPQVQLPSALGDLLRHPEIRENIKLEYSLPAPLLGFIPIKGEISGDNLYFDLTNNVVSGEVKVPLNLTLIGIYEFTFKIDIAGLNLTIPEQDYQFRITVGEDAINLALLEFPQSMTNLRFGYAAITDPSEGEPSQGDGTSTATAQTAASVTFLPSLNDSPDVLNPQDPTVPYEDPPDAPTGETGPLTIDYVSSLYFDGGEVSNEPKQIQSSNLLPFVQVTDRRGTGEGWTLTAQLNEFHSTQSNSQESYLNGSKIILNRGSLISPSTANTPYANQNVEIAAGGDAVIVIMAPSESGSGSWLNRWFPSEDNDSLNNNVLLDVPSGQSSVGSYQATITWTLTDTPTDSE